MNTIPGWYESFNQSQQDLQDAILQLAEQDADILRYRNALEEIQGLSEHNPAIMSIATVALEKAHA